MKPAVPAESYVIHLSSSSWVSCDVYGQWPGGCRTLSFFLIHWKPQDWYTKEKTLNNKKHELKQCWEVSASWKPLSNKIKVMCTQLQWATQQNPFESCVHHFTFNWYRFLCGQNFSESSTKRVIFFLWLCWFWRQVTCMCCSEEKQWK